MLLNEIVKKIVLKKMRKGQPFTSKDITRKARKKNPFMTIANAEVSSLLRGNVLQWSYADSYQYNVKLITVTNNDEPVKTYLYYPDGFYPENYHTDI